MADLRERELEQLYSRFAGRVYAYALRRSDPATADDVLAETFVVVWRRFDRVPLEPLPWLYGVARRVLANQTRGATRRRALVSRLIAQPVHHQPPPADELRPDWFEKLRPADRELLALLAWEGLTQSEAATVLGCSSTAVRVRLHRIRRRVTLIIEQSNTDCSCGGRELADGPA